MTKNPRHSAPLARGTTARELDSLNIHTPYGLFRGCSGNKYIVTADFATKVAVALVHETLPPFTWQALCDQTIDCGRTLGAYQLRVTHKLPEGEHFPAPGAIQLGEGGAVIDCVDALGGVSCIALGKVEGLGDYFRDHDCWAVEALGKRSNFFALSGASNTDRVVQPVPELTRLAAQH